MAKHLQEQLTKKDLPAKSKARFNFMLDDNDFEEFTRGYMSHNTTYDTQKCVKLITEWTSVRNACFPETPVPASILASQKRRKFANGYVSLQQRSDRKMDNHTHPKQSNITSWVSNGIYANPLNVLSIF